MKLINQARFKRPAKLLTSYIAIASLCSALLNLQPGGSVRGLVVPDEFAGHAGLGAVLAGTPDIRLAIIGPSYTLVGLDADIISENVYGSVGHVVNLSHNWPGYDVSYALAQMAMEKTNVERILFYIGSSQSSYDQVHALSPYFITWDAVVMEGADFKLRLALFASFFQSLLIKVLVQLNLVHTSYPTSYPGGMVVSQGFNGAQFSPIADFNFNDASVQDINSAIYAGNFGCYWLDNLMENAHGHGVDVTFVIPPFYEDTHDEAILSHSLCRKTRDVSVLKISIISADELDAFYYNSTHLNRNGATLASVALSNYLSRSGGEN